MTENLPPGTDSALVLFAILMLYATVLCQGEREVGVAKVQRWENKDKGCG